MSTAALEPRLDDPKAAPRAVLRLLRSGSVSEAQRERIRALHPDLVAQVEAPAPATSKAPGTA